MRKAHFFTKIIFKGLDIQYDGSKKGSTPDVIYPVIAAVTVPIFTLAPSYIPGGRRSFIFMWCCRHRSPIWMSDVRPFRAPIPELTPAWSGQLGQDPLHLGAGESTQCLRANVTQHVRRQ
jgi:hypothetical protein